MKISEIITDKYKLRIEPTVYYDLLADVREAEEEQEPCEDAVSREAVLDITWEEPSYTDAMNVLTEVRDKVKELPPVNQFKPICCPSMGIDCEDCPAYEPKTGWIPVSERLPEEYCLFCDIDGDVFYGHIYDDRWWAEGQDDRIKNVIAWMPLPEPYKAEGGDKE